MRPPVIAMQQKLFSPNLMDQLNPNNEWLLLGRVMDWASLDAQFGSGFASGFGRPAIPTRTILGLLIARQMRDLSDRGVIDLFVESPYIQAFCGYTEFQMEPPCDASTLTRWRKRKGNDLESLLAATIQAALESGALKEKDLHAVVIDTTVQEKAVTPPSDGKLLYAMQKALVREARSRGIEIKRLGLREARKRKVKHARLRHGLKHKAAKRVLRRMRTLLRRVERQVSVDFNRLDETLVNLLRMARTVRMQSRGLVPAKEKIYSVHAPEVECIGKGKPHKPWEFGVKVGLAATAKSCFVTAADTFPENPYDGATLEPTIAQMERVTGVTPAIAAVDQGYKGKRYHPARTGIFVANTVKLGGKLLRFIKRRSAIEPIIGHLKNERGMRHNRLLGELGDRINALMSAIAWNLAKIARHLAGRARALWRLLLLLIRVQIVLMRLRLDCQLFSLPEAA